MAAALGIVTLAARLATAATGPTDWDAVQFAVGSARFDVRHGAPHPPGYFLFVTAGRALHVVTGMSATASLVLVAALASAAAAACTVIAGADLGGRFVAGAAGTLMAASPVSWFNGSIAATYSFDALAAAGFTVLARRARPGSRHGVVAASAFGLAIGFRQSIAQLFGFLVVMAVAGSARSWRTIVGAALAGAGCLAAWFVPMVVVQPGGFAAWVRATHAEALGAYRTSSVLASTTKGLTSLGTMGAYALLLLGPVAVLGVGASVGLLALRLRRRRLPERPVSAGPESTSPPACPPASGPARALAAPRKRRAREPQLGAGPTPGPSAACPQRWFQRPVWVLSAALVPPLAVLGLVAFEKGGYALAFLPTATIALLLPVASLARRLGTQRSRILLTVAAVGVAAIVAADGQRFLWGAGILPMRLQRDVSGLWLAQPRYLAPYPETAHTIEAADAADAAFARLAPLVRPSTDVVVMVSYERGLAYYRNVGFALPQARVELVFPPRVVYEEHEGLLWYTSDDHVEVGPGGAAWFLVTSDAPEMTALAPLGLAQPTGLHIAGYHLWRVLPGAHLFEIDVRATAGPRPLGYGL